MVVPPLSIARLRQPVRIAFENKSKSELAQQTDCSESQNGAINSAHLEVVLRLHFLYEPSVLIIWLLRIESECGHSWPPFMRVTHFF